MVKETTHEDYTYIKSFKHQSEDMFLTMVHVALKIRGDSLNMFLNLLLVDSACGRTRFWMTIRMKLYSNIESPALLKILCTQPMETSIWLQNI